MINTFLFDLDGTLLPMNMKKFIKIYFEELAKKLKEYIPLEKTSEYIWEATKYMVKNIDSEVSNQEAFQIHFDKISNQKFQKLFPILDDFYKNEFVKAKKACSTEPLVREIIDILKEKGYTIVVATNPLFPKRAMLHRIEWAGLQEKEFQLITSYENMHACKPNIQYYREILDIIGKEPEECIMIGNDVQEDLVAGQLDISTFLVEDYIIHREKSIPKCDYKGSYKDLKNLILNDF